MSDSRSNTYESPKKTDQEEVRAVKRIKAIIEYDGNLYHGYQKQKNAYTIQECVENTILKLVNENTSIYAAGRTDARVHALGQVIAFDTNSSIPPNKWKFALNSLLPSDIRVLQSCMVKSSFHPRFDAMDKRYIYLIYTGDTKRVFYNHYTYCLSDKLNLSAMQQACTYLVGKHNFRSFCSSGTSVNNFERDVKYCSVNKKGTMLMLDITANGFLYNMVRIITGTLIEIGQQKYNPEYMAEILDSRDRNMAGQTAPPQGLYLHSVNYGKS